MGTWSNSQKLQNNIQIHPTPCVRQCWISGRSRSFDSFVVPLSSKGSNLWFICLSKTTKWPTQLIWLSWVFQDKTFNSQHKHLCKHMCRKGPACPGFALRDAQPAEEAKGQVESFMKAREWISGSSFLQTSYMTLIFERYLYPVHLHVCLQIKHVGTKYIRYVNISHICRIS